MATISTTVSSISTVYERVDRIPWYVWCAVLGVTSAMIGGQWDISWHRSIGRDTFWTPAHMAIYLCGITAGLSCGYLILATTFGNFSQLRSTAVKMWGFEAPLGAFIAAWGGVAMLTSAPFDNWWHSAVRTGCQNPQPTPCPADPRQPGREHRHADPDPGHDESRAR